MDVYYYDLKSTINGNVLYTFKLSVDLSGGTTSGPFSVSSNYITQQESNSIYNICNLEITYARDGNLPTITNAWLYSNIGIPYFRFQTAQNLNIAGDLIINTTDYDVYKNEPIENKIYTIGGVLNMVNINYYVNYTLYYGGPEYETIRTNTQLVSLPQSNICFVAGTPVDTDQGAVAIDQLDPERHTIRGKRISVITKTTSIDKTLVRIEKGAIGPRMPSATTIVSPAHKIFYHGRMSCARDIREGRQIPYDGQLLYNIGLEDSGIMVVNNLMAETLPYDNPIARFFRETADGKLSIRDQRDLIRTLQKQTKSDGTAAT